MSVAPPLAFVAYPIGNRGAGRDLPCNILGLIGNVIPKGSPWPLPYAADRLIVARLNVVGLVLIGEWAFLRRNRPASART